MIGGVALNHRRSPVKRPRKAGLLRAFPAVLTGAELRCTGGAWVKEAGSDEERRFVRDEKLSRNIGDGLVVIGDDVAFAVVTAVSGSWLETWTVRLSVPIANGNVMVLGAMKARKR